MAAGSLLMLLDDIATVLDDVAILTKVATKKTAGVLGDDLALNAQQVSGVRAERELPVVWAVTKGSVRNKVILVPVALLLSAFLPQSVPWLLMIGGAYLCFEGVEKLAHRWLHSKAEVEANHAAITHALTHPEVDLMALEKDKIAGAVRTDFVLSAEIITIALGTVADKPVATQAAVLVGVALVMTIGVYGFVAAIVKMDDAGLALTQRTGAGGWDAALRALGSGLLWFAPWLMKALGIAGTLAMFLVGGGILVHGWPAIHHAITNAVAGLGQGVLQGLATMSLEGLWGVVVGAVVLALVMLGKRLRGS